MYTFGTVFCLTYLVKTVSFPFQTKADPDFESASPSPNMTLTESRTASPDMPEFPKAVKADVDAKESVVVKIKKEKVALPSKAKRKYTRTKKQEEYVEREDVSVPIQEVQL